MLLKLLEKVKAVLTGLVEPYKKLGNYNLGGKAIIPNKFEFGLGKCLEWLEKRDTSPTPDSTDDIHLEILIHLSSRGIIGEDKASLERYIEDYGHLELKPNKMKKLKCLQNTKPLRGL